MIRLQFKYLLIFFFFASVIPAQTVNHISIEGTRIFDKQTYLDWLKIKTVDKIKNPTALNDSLRNRISKYLAAEGYYDFDIKKISLTPAKDSTIFTLTFHIAENEPTYIKQIKLKAENLDGNDSLNVLPELESLKDKIFKKSLVEKSVARVLNYYEENGFPFAKVKIYSVSFSYDSLTNKHFADIIFSIDKNRISKIDKIEIKGNTKTKPEVIIRNLRIEHGEIYSEEKIADIPRKLNRLQFFEKVDKPQFYFNSKNEGILLIKVKEKQTNFFDGILGFVPGKNKNEKGYFTGFVNVNLRNLFGTDRAFAVKWLQENRFSQELELNYLEPWIFNYPFNFEAGLYQRKQDTTYIKRKIEGSIEYLTTENISASIFLTSGSTFPILNDENKFTVFNSSSLSTGVKLRIDTRNNPLAPKSGILFINSYAFTAKKINGPEQFLTEQTPKEINLQRLELDFAFYYEFLQNQVAQLSVHGKELRGSSFEISDLYKFGGTNSIRGYREKQFSANRILWSNIEYRYLISEYSYAFLFFDIGYYLRNENQYLKTEKVSEVLKSFGIGFSLESALGILNISYAVPQGSSIGKGLIHFGILNNF